MQLYARLQRQMPTLGLVLTCDLASYAPVDEIVSKLGLREKITLLPRSSEGVLRWLYRNASLLCLTSVMEGNFPPQVLEALSYGTPVVATRLPTITELLGDDERDLLLCEPLDFEDFLAKIQFAFDNGAEVLDRQRRIVSLLSKWNSPKAFSDSLGRALPEMLPAPEVA
jgi:glycosyltransferase involved in cell wall biosynthesis